MLYNILLIIQIIVSAAMIALILMQHGKGADAGAAFGSGTSGTVFGSQGSANFLSHTTAILATVFFLNSLGLAWLVAHRTTAPTSSIVDQIQPRTPPAPSAAPSSTTVPPAASEVPALAPPASEAPATEQAPVVPAIEAVETEIDPAAPTQ